MDINRCATIHRHANHVALAFDDTETIYLTPADARRLSRELLRFADAAGGNTLAKHEWPCQRYVSDGEARNVSDGARRPVYC